jgi:putative DNA primase/helicase
MSAETIAKKLEKARRSGNGWVACCPAHPDRNASLSLSDGTDGKILAKCHAGCSFAAIAAALLKRGISLNSKQPQNSRGKLVASYDYTGENGKLLYQSCRFEPKRFTQRQPDGKGGWQWNLRGVDIVPYRLPALKAAIAAGRQVLIVEGEKDVDNLVKLGFEATTGPMGAGKWSPQLCPYFEGARVVIIPDNDGPGRGHARLVGGALRGFATEIVVLDLPDLPDKGDVSDWIAAGGNAKQLRALIDCTALHWADWLADQPVQKETEQETLARLAALSIFEYDRVREAEAEALNVRPAILDKEVARARGQAAEAAEDAEVEDFLVDPEPWPDSVDLAELLDRLTAIIKSHLVLPHGAAETIALWVIFAHAHDCFQMSPLLGVTSPTPSCGKTTVLTLMGSLVPRACPASNITAPALFRAVEKWGPSLLIDEGDTFIKSSDEMRGVLNSGHQRSCAYVIRNVGDDHEPRRFRTWCPKAVALIGKLPATLESRAIHIEMRRKTAGEKVQPLRADRLDHMVPLCRQAARWVTDNNIRLRSIDPEMPAELSNRAADNWRPLLAIADAAGGEWPARARVIAVNSGGSRGEQTVNIMLLEYIKRIFAEDRIDRIPSQELVAKLAKMEERPWVEWHHGKPITTRQIARLLEPFKVAPGTIRTLTPKGYMAADFSDAFARYTPSRSATMQQADKNNELQPNPSATRDSDVADKIDGKPNDFKACGGVADKKASHGHDGQSAHLLCALCGDFDLPGDALRLFGLDPPNWLHQGCWTEWRNRRANGSATHDGASGGPS